MLVIGLTGGIGAGKTTVANLFAEKLVPVIDADIITRELTLPGSAVVKAIVEHFGDNLLSSDGKLNRAALRSLIFENIDDRRWLEALLHPLVAKAIKKKIAQLKAPYCIVVIPLLLEVGSYPFIDRILVVDLAEAAQIERAMARDKLDRPDIEAIMKTQILRELRLAKADDVIVNDGEMNDLLPQVEKLHQRYLELTENGNQTKLSK